MRLMDKTADNNDYLLWDNRGKGGGATGVIAKYGDKDFL